MKNLSPHEKKVLDYLREIAPQGATNSDICKATQVQPHQQVFQITQKLLLIGLIEGEKGRYRGREWYFRARGGID